MWLVSRPLNAIAHAPDKASQWYECRAVSFLEKRFGIATAMSRVDTPSV